MGCEIIRVVQVNSHTESLYSRAKIICARLKCVEPVGVTQLFLKFLLALISELVAGVVSILFQHVNWIIRFIYSRINKPNATSFLWVILFVAISMTMPLVNQAKAQTQNFTISLSWNSGQTTTIDSVDGTSTYDDITATVEYNVNGFLYGSAEESGSTESFYQQFFASGTNTSHANLTIGMGSLTYGHWQIQSLAKCQSDTKYCGTVTFVTNDTKVSELVGTTITPTLTLYYMARQGTSQNYNQVGDGVSISATINGQSEVSLSWDNDFNGKIYRNETSNTTHPNINGTLSTFDKSSTYATLPSVEETIGAQTPTTDSTGGSASNTIGYQAKEYGSTFTYGSWHVATDFTKFTFEPNSTNIQNLQTGTTVKSKLTINIAATSTSMTNLATAFIEVEITRTTAIEMKWSSGKINERFEGDGVSTTYEDIKGKISIQQPEASPTVRIVGSQTSLGSSTTASNFANSPELTGYIEVGLSISNNVSSYAFSTVRWFVKSDYTEFILRPTALGTPGNMRNFTGINNIKIGSNTSASLTIHYCASTVERNMCNSTTSLDSKTVSINLFKGAVDVTSSWHNESSDTIRLISDNSTEYPAMGGNTTIANIEVLNSFNNLPSRYQFSHKFTEQKNQDASQDGLFTRFEQIEGELWNSYADGMTYGEWSYQIKQDRLNFQFLPNPEAINLLQSRDTVTSTYTFSVYRSDGTGSSDNITPENLLGEDSVTVEISVFKPTVQITSTVSSVVESTAFTFTLMVTPAPATNEVFPVALTLDPPSTPYLDSDFKLTYDIGSTGMLDVTVPTNLQAPDVDDATIKIEIVENIDLYRIREDYHKIDFGIMKIADSPKSVISITSDSDDGSIGEGKGFMFKLTANQAPTADLEVNLTISDDSDFIETDLSNPFTIPTSGVLDVDVITQADADSKEDGEIEISIAEHSNYYISGKENQISITVENVSTVITISAGDGPYTEGSPIILSVTSSEPPANPVPVSVDVREMNGDDILSTSSRTFQVELTLAKTTETVSIQTVKNGIHMLGGSLAVSITTTNTEVAVGPSISVAVEDADVTPPIVSISTRVASVTEGATDSDGALIGAEITLTANNSAANVELPITLEIDDGDHNFFTNANPDPVVVNLPARERSVTHTITPENDEVKEAPGKFTVTIQAPANDTNFTVAEAPRNMVSIQFVDDDIMEEPLLPEVSVSPVLANITEGMDDNASFNLIITPTPTTTTSISIRYLITVSGDYLQDQANNIGEKTEMITFQNGEFTVDLLIDDDDDSEPRGTITFKLLYETADLTYLIDTDNNTAEVVVTDDEGGIFPQINITAEDSVVEGEDIIFTLTATTMDGSLLTTELVFNLILTQTGSFLADNAGTRSIRMRDGIAMKVESTILLANRVSGGMITAEVEHDSASPPTYSRGEEFRKVVDVELYTNPIVSIDARTTSITAGATAVLTISTPNPSETSDLNVLVNINQSHEFIRWRIPSVYGIPMGQESIDIKIPTRKKMLSEDTEGSITVTIQVSSDYQFRGDPEEVIIMVNGSEEDPPGARLSVADAVVNAILNLNQDDPVIPETVEQSPIAESVEPIVSIQANEHVVAEGQPVQFLIKTQVTNSNDLKVNLIINGGHSFVNLTSTNQQVAISRGQSNTLYTLATIDDERAEEDETLIVSIAEGEGYSIADSPLNQASVSISDANDRAEYNQSLSAANRSLIPELMATTGIQSYQTISNRVQLAFNNEEQFLFEVGGQSNPTQILQLSGQTLNNQNDLLDLLRDDTEIAIRLTSDNSLLNNTTAWLKSENQNIYILTNTDANSWNGEFYTGNFGIDTQLDSGLLLGIATSMTENDISYTVTSDQAFEYTASYTGFNPYIALNSPTLNTQVWLSSNVSSGYIDVNSQQQRTHRLNSNYSTITFGGESRLLSLNDLPFNGSSEFNLTGQGWLGQQHIFGDGHFTSDFSTKGHHVQISLAGNHKIDIAEIGTFNPNVLIGIRDAKRDTDTVTGVEFGMGALYSNNFGLTFEGFGRGFKGSEQQNYATTFTSTLTYNPNHDNTGSQLTISPTWGQSTGQTQLSLWQSNLNRENELFDKYTNGLQISSEYSYGIDLLDGIGVLLPYSAINYSESDFMSFDIGNRIEIGTDSSFEIIGTREVRNNNITTNKVQLQGTVRW